MGNFVHRVLEATDFAAPDLRTALVAAVAGASRLGAPPLPADPLVDALEAAVTTPLNPLLPGETLARVPRSDRLDELGFELPVAGGDHPTGSVRTAAIADLLDRHLEPGDRLAGYADRLRDPSLDVGLRGYLVGSLDLVFRRPASHGHRWYVADYKTNWLGPPGAPLSATHYTGAAMEAEMRHRHYPLQALLYTVALHRYLRWRQPGYRPETHLGGVLYLFVRGMAGPATPILDGATCGVWSWPVPAALVVALSDLMDAGSEEVA